MWGSPLVWVTVYRQAHLHFTVEGTRGSDRLRDLPRAAQLMSNRAGGSTLMLWFQANTGVPSWSIFLLKSGVCGRVRG